ncbi:MAG: amidase [Actinomycetota bacterium]|nr:amidase [Actinomycetota bacterium]
MTDLAFAGPVEQALRVRSGQVTPTELVDLYLERIERLDPHLNSFRAVLGERAKADAKLVERRLDAGDGGRMPLAGVPIALKDTDDVEGEVTCWGSAAFDEPAKTDGEVVRRLREAGAIVIGKTNLPELAICGFTETERWGTTRNPWDTTRTPAGSSGGSAAAVAAGLCSAASASDGAGSIRLPAAFCGVFGLKPQRDRISLAPVREHWHGLSVAGAVTRTVADTGLWLDVCAGGVPGGPPDAEHTYLAAAKASPRRLRIAWSVKPPRLMAPAIVTDEVKGAVEDTARLLRGLGHQVERRDPDWGLVGNNISARYLNGITEEVRRVARPERLERRTRQFARLGKPLGNRVLRRARRQEGPDARRILSIFEHADVLITPVTGELPFEVGRWKGKGALQTVVGMSRSYPFAAVWNHIGNPAASVPAGFSQRGLPLAVQLIGRPSDEGTLLQLAAQLEAERPWAGMRPPVS